MSVSIAVVLGSTEAAPSRRLALFDRAALEMAVAHFPRSVHACCTTEDDATFRFASAAGAQRVSSIGGPQSVTQSIVVIGPGALRDRGVVFAAEIAEANSAELVFDVVEMTSVTAHSVVVRRGLSRGERDELEIKLPVVLVAHAQAQPRHYVSVYRQKFASLAGLPIAEIAKCDLRTASVGPWGPVVPRVRLEAAATIARLAMAEQRTNSVFGLDCEESQSARRGEPIQADAATCAAHLIRYLSHHGQLPPRFASSIVEVSAPIAAAQIQPAIVGLAASAASAPQRTRRPRLAGEEAWVRHQRHPRLLDTVAPADERKKVPSEPATANVGSNVRERMIASSGDA